MRCYLHIRDGDSLVADPNGQDFQTDVEAMYEALQTARRLITSRTDADKPADRRTIVVEDETQRIIGQLPVSHDLVIG